MDTTRPPGPDRIARHAVWLPTGRGAAAAWVHVPRSAQARNRAVVICPAFGYEYTHSHRSLLHLADALAAEGFVTMRLDYLGTGDSEGDASTPDLLDAWVESIRTAASRASEVVGGAPVALIGLRLGALLAGLAANRTDVAELVAWYPVASGRRYIREHEALGKVSSERAPSPEAPIDAGGFVLSFETAEALKAVDLRRTPLGVKGRSLVIQRDDLGPDDRLVEHLRAGGVVTDVLKAAGYLGMMAEPQYTVVPYDTIDAITAWLASGVTARDVDIDTPALDRLISERSMGMTSQGRQLVEEHVTIPGEEQVALQGVLTRSTDHPIGARHALLLLNSGSVHHVGPNRFYVELARAVAATGVACLRLDLRNLGDSRMGASADENHPYPDTALNDVTLAMEWLAKERGVERCILAGLCSGAHTAFRAGLEVRTRAIAAVICINPLTFQWHEGMSLDTPTSYQTTRDAQYYAHTVRSWRKWMKLLRGQADTGYIVRFVAKRIGERIRTFGRNTLDRMGLRAPGRLAVELTRYDEAGRPLRFVFSSRDPGYQILDTEARFTVRRLIGSGSVGVHFIQDADHTFSRAAWRREAIGAVCAELESLADRQRPSS